jgi:chemotaxis protein histidine kinase CheA
MEFLNFPIVALGAALVCLIGITIYTITLRNSLRSRDEQLVVARAQAYAMLELSQAGVLFLDREHKLMGEASSAAPELLGHTCGAGTAFVQTIAELVDVHKRREAVAYLESLWKAEASAVVDATQNPLAKVHSGSRHLAIKFARLVVDGRVHHIIVSIERISAPRVVPHTIEVPVLDEETFARRLAGETGTRPAPVFEDWAEPARVETPVVATPAASAAPAVTAAPSVVTIEAVVAEQPLVADVIVTEAPAQVAATLTDDAAAITGSPLTGEFELGPLDVTEDSLPSVPKLNPAVLPASAASIAMLARLDDADVAANTPTLPTPGDVAQHLATTITSPDVLQEEADAVLAAAIAKRSPPPVAPTPAPSAAPAVADPASIIDPPDARMTEALKEILHVDAERLEAFLSEAREKAGQLRAIIKLPARDPQAFREKLVLILELIRGIHARAARLPLASVGERAERFEAALNKLRDKRTLSGNDFLPLAVKLDDLLSHLAIQGEVAGRLRAWRLENGLPEHASLDATQRSATATGTTIRQPRLRAKLAEAAASAGAGATTISQPGGGKSARLSDLSQDSLREMSQFLSDMYAKRVSLVCVGLEDVPAGYRKTVEKILGQLIHNAIRHGVESPDDRASHDKPAIGTVSVQFSRAGADGFQLSVQDDGRGLDHERIRAEAVRQGVLTPDAAKTIDPRKLASLIFRPGFTTVGESGARGIGMDVVRELVTKVGGRVGIATKPGEYTRFRITLPHEKKDSNAAVA